MRTTRSILLAAFLMCVTAAVWAHHGWSSYDAQKVMKFDAALVDVRYRNPHAEVDVKVDGKPWVAVLAPVSRMQARGLPEGALTPGKTVTIEGYPRTDGTPELRAERITIDGKTIELR